MSDNASDARRFRATLAARLLRDAAKTIDEITLARVIGVPTDGVQDWAEGRVAMTLSDRVRVAMAIITLAPAGTTLFRHAARLRAQLLATVEFDRGVTSATQTPPHLRV